MADIDISQDLKTLENEIASSSDELKKLDEHSGMLIARIQQLTGAAGYLRGKQDPIEESTGSKEESAEEEKSKEESTDNK